MAQNELASDSDLWFLLIVLHELCPPTQDQWFIGSDLGNLRSGCSKAAIGDQEATDCNVTGTSAK
jgi:hypothetical protein